jgi:hypothetical protein
MTIPSRRTVAKVVQALNLAMAVAVVGAASGCSAGSGDANQVAAGVDLNAFHSRFTVVDSLVLEEAGSAVMIDPIMAMDSKDGFLIVEEGEQHVRVYSASGELRKVFGAGTGKVDSLRGPTGAARLENGDIIATSLMTDKLTFVPQSDTVPVRRVSTHLRLLEGVLVLSDHQVLLTGPDLPYPRALLHIYDVSADSLVKSFFPPPAHVDSNVALTLGRVHVADRGGRLAVVHSLSDTVYLFDRLGVLQSSVPIPIDSFTVPAGLPEINSLAKRRQWIDRRTLLWDVFWVGERELMVQTVMGRRSDAVYTLVQLDTTGRRMWRIERSPRLLGVRDGKYYFQDPSSRLANRLIVATQTRE